MAIPIEKLEKDAHTKMEEEVAELSLEIGP